MKKSDIKFIIIVGIVGVVIIGGLYQLIISPLLTSHFLNKESRYAITSSIGGLSHGETHGSYTRDYHFSFEGKIYMGQFNSFYFEGPALLCKILSSEPKVQ